MALRVNEAIHLAIGFASTYLVTTPAGNVVISPIPTEKRNRE
jgi:hypothetical protein